MKFYLGIWIPSWGEKLNIPFMLSVRGIVNRKKEVPGNDWIMDSGGFTELAKFGEYTITLKKYLEVIKRFSPTNGAFCQDWMCENFILKKTGKTVREHQQKTIDSYLSMKNKYNKTIPVLQGWTLIDYLKHADLYHRARVPIEQLFGLGSVCSRSSTKEIEIIITGIKREFPEIKLHAFGVKTTALKKRAVIDCLFSADSVAWNYGTMFSDKKENRNSMKYALEWYNNIVEGVKTIEEHKPDGYLWGRKK